MDDVQREWMRRYRVPAVACLVAVALSGVAAVLLVVWVVDAVAPGETVRATITENQVTAHDTSDEYREDTKLQARTEDGRALGLPPYSRIARSVAYGEPVLIQLSRVTGDVVEVRTTDKDYRLRLSGTRVVGMIFALLVLISVGTWGRGVLRIPHWTAVVAVAVLAAGLTALTRLGGAEIGSTGPLTDAVGLQIYDDRGQLPARTVGTGEQVDVHQIRLRVTGPLVSGPPAGSASWLGGFRVLTVPVTAALLSDSTGYVQTELIGHGPGRAVEVHAADCAGPGRAFDGELTPERPAVTGAMCYVVPPNFRPTYLVVASAEPDGVAVRVTTPAG